MGAPKDPEKYAEWIRKKSEAGKGRTHSPETKKKISDSHAGIPLSDEHKKKISDTLKDRQFSEEHRERLSVAGKGKKHGPLSEERRRAISESLLGQVGEKSRRWAGGRVVDCQGYVHIFFPDHPYSCVNHYVREHRLVMEEFLSRYLTPEEIVHHIDGNKSNNCIENLQLFSTNGEHTAYHNKNPLFAVLIGEKDMDDRLIETLEFYAHPCRGPLFEFVALRKVQSREHRLGCVCELVSSMLLTARAEMSEDLVLWELVAWFSSPDNMDYE
jgi:hypothetical protein